MTKLVSLFYSQEATEKGAILMQQPAENMVTRTLVRVVPFYINHFTAADTIVSDPKNPQSFNRYAYAMGNPIKYKDSSGHCVQNPETGECVSVDEPDASPPPPVPVIELKYKTITVQDPAYPDNPEKTIEITVFDPVATWAGLEDWDLLARMLIAEEGYKILDPIMFIDAVGAAWTVINRTMAGSGYGYAEGDIFAAITSGGQYSGMETVGLARRAANPEAYFSPGDPELGRKVYWAAVRIAKGILNGSIPDPTNGRLIYADELADGTHRDRTAFWYVQGSHLDDPNDPHLTIPEISQAQLPFELQFTKLNSLLVDQGS